jgi:hypothetical protein
LLNGALLPHEVLPIFGLVLYAPENRFQSVTPNLDSSQVYISLFLFPENLCGCNSQLIRLYVLTKPKAT